MKIPLANIKKYQPKTLSKTPLSAAVMLILLYENNEPREIVLTKRAAALTAYGGQYSLPGGLCENIDIDFYATAIREVQEELGLHQNDYRYMGQLDDFYDRFKHVVRPFVVYMSKQDFLQKVTVAINEISALYYFPLENLATFADDPTLHALTNRNPSYVFKEDDVFVWGLTASILVHFKTLLSSS